MLSIVVVRDLLEPAEMKHERGRRGAFVSQENVDCRNKESVAMELRHSVTVHFLFCPQAT